MMERSQNTKDVLKQALERRETGSLPSNFSFRMMESIHLEAKKQRRRRARLNILALGSAVLSLLGLGVYFLVFYLEFNIQDYIPSINMKDDLILLKFYSLIAVLALLLLGLDYWLRKKYIWK